MSYPEVISTVEAAIVERIQTLDIFDPNAGATVKGVGSIQTFLDLTAMEPPSAIVVFDGERANPDQTIGKVTQLTSLHWAVYVAAASFGTDVEGRLGDAGAYKMIDALASADGLEGFEIDFPEVIRTKLTYNGAARYHVCDTAVIYEVKFRHQYLRQGA